MYSNCAELTNHYNGYKDKSKKLVVTSCGTYRLHSIPKLPTYRPRGRIDWQLIYIVSGKAYFHFHDISNETIVNSGNIILFQPKELQKYEYYGADKTEVFWVHFTGSDVKNLMHRYQIPFEQHVFYVGNSTEYVHIFHRMIQEMQMRGEGFEEMLTILLGQILIFLGRSISNGIDSHQRMRFEIENACKYFIENYNASVNIEKYAESIGLSSAWFISQFREYTGSTPGQYLITLRMTNAQHLLRETNDSIGRIALQVGYENPLYFSRIFKKQTGLPPSQYRLKFKNSPEPPAAAGLPIEM